MIPLIIASWVACGLAAVVWAVKDSGFFLVGDIPVALIVIILGPIMLLVSVGFYLRINKDVIIWKKGGKS